MFGTIRKHQTWLWMFIIAATIVSFVIFFTPTADHGSGVSSAAQFGTIDGRPITRKEYFQAYYEAKLAFFLQNGMWPDQGRATRTGFSAEREAATRLVLLDRIKDVGIEVDEASIANWIVEQFGGGQPGSARAKYENFVRELRKYGVTEAAFHQFIGHEIALRHLVAVAGIGGQLVTPREGANLYRQEHEEIEADVVLFSSSNHLATVTLDPDAIARFYTNRQNLYRNPERIQVLYVRFPLTNYLAQADATMAKDTNLAAQIDRAYLTSNPNNFLDTNGQALPPDAAKARIRTQVRDQQALTEAHKEAARFATALDEMKPAKAENLETLAASKGLTVAVTEPFAERATPVGLRVRQNFVDMAFKLTDTDPIALSPIKGEDAVYVIALKQRTPSEVPALEAIRPRVVEDFRRDEALRLARETGTNFLATLTNAMAGGTSFADAAAAAQVPVISLPKFAAARPGADWDRRVDFSQVRGVTTSLAPGKTSGLIPVRDGAMIVHLKTRTPPNEETLNRELPKFLADLRRSEQFDAFNEWFRKQVELSRIDTIKGRDETEQ